MDELEHLLGAYYHEDFECIWNTLDEYLSETPSQDVLELVTDIDTLVLESTAPGFDMRARLFELGSYVYLGDSDTAYRDWVTELRRRCLLHLQSPGEHA